MHRLVGDLCVIQRDAVLEPIGKIERHIPFLFDRTVHQDDFQGVLRRIAAEIRKLAETAGESAGQIEKLVSQLEEGSGNVSRITQSMGEEVRERREDLTEILQALERVQGSIEKASNRAEQIVEQATHQSADGEHLVRDIETIAQEVTNGAKATDEMREGLSGQREAMDEMVRQVARLSGMSSELNEVAQRFRTR